MNEPTQAEEDLMKILRFILRSKEPVSLYMSQSGHPTLFSGVGCSQVGVYTQEVSIRQLKEDIREADRERRRRVAA